MMKKRKTRLEIEQKKVQQAINATNKKIEELGSLDKWMYDLLNELQGLFDQIRNVPSEKQFEYEEQIRIKNHWKEQVEEIEREYDAAVAKNAGKAVAGAGVGVAMAALGPTAAMGVATTFGVASTGAAISSLNGIAATNAALAWLGGGTLAAGGGGVAAGEAFLAMAGPIGWAIAGVTLLTSGLFIWKNINDNKRLSEIFLLISKRDLMSYELAIVELGERIEELKTQIFILGSAINEIATFGTDYDMMSEEQQYKLGSYLNDLKRASHLLTEAIRALSPKYEEIDYKNYYFNSRGYLDTKSILGDDYHKKAFYYKKDMIVCLANLFYKIDISKEDKRLLWRTLRKNEGFLESINKNKKNFSLSTMDEVSQALIYKYRTFENRKRIKSVKAIIAIDNE